MEQTISRISKNALFAMVDLTIDLGDDKQLWSQKNNVVEFLIDCWNLSKSDLEFMLLVDKFVEEFQNQERFEEMTASDIEHFFEGIGQSLLSNFQLPPVIAEAIALHSKTS